MEILDTTDEAIGFVAIEANIEEYDIPEGETLNLSPEELAELNRKELEECNRVAKINSEERERLLEPIRYALLRKDAYQKLNQDELRYNDMMNGTNTWGEAIELIKETYPKPVEGQ